MSRDATSDRAIRLFQFLRELTLLRTQTVRTLDKYEKVLWFNDVPDDADCFSVYRTEAEDRSEVWLEIKQPQVPPPPRLPSSLVPWIDPEQLADASLESPSLRNVAVIEKPIASGVNPRFSPSNANSADPSSPVMDADLSQKKKGRGAWGRVRVETEVIKLTDSPGIESLWLKYLEDEWKPWAQKARPFAPAQRLYDQLFEIHHTLQKLAENFELLLGVGCLSWKTSKQPVTRHILTARASIHFDASRGVFTVGAPIEGVGFLLEQDMLELSERPPAQQRREIDGLLAELAKDFWNEIKTSELLESFVHAISSRGAFSTSLKRPPQPDIEPIVNLAPAIILRQRTDLHFVRLFEEIVGQIEDGQEIPLGVERLVNILDDETTPSTHSEKRDEELEDEEIYFPLPANPDQREIAQRLRTRQGILVQGPPGTGKSHTIVNLVCHLLASGKRILVTSHTPRALNVLRDKFPTDLQALCVSVVGDDSSESRKALEDSVAGITAKHNSWSQSQNMALIYELREQLDNLRRGEQWTLNALRSIKEKDTYNHIAKFSKYSGTAQSIAKQLNQTQHLSWLQASPGESDEPPLTNDEAGRLLRLLRAYDDEKEREISKETLSEQDLLSPKDLTEIGARIKAATSSAQQVAAMKDHECYDAATKLSSEDRSRLVRALDELLALFYQIAKRPEEFAKIVAREVIGDHDRKWRELLTISKELLAGLKDSYREIAQKTVIGLEKRDFHTVKTQASNLRDHFWRGWKAGFGPFRAKIVKEGLYLINEVRIDGELCDTTSALEKLIEYLELELIVQSLKKNWAGVCDNVPTSPIAAIATFQDFCEPIDDALRLYDRMISLREELSQFPSLIAPKWEDIESIKTFRNVIAAGAAEEEILTCKRLLQEYETKLRAVSTSPKAHPFALELLESLTCLDEERYHATYHKNVKLLASKQALRDRDNLLRRLEEACPVMANQLSKTFSESKWEERCTQFVDAWRWNQAIRWISELSNPQTFKRHSLDLEKSQSEIRDTLRNLAGAKAWDHTFRRLTEIQRQHLVSWSMAVRRVGKGKGKYAEKHRRDARFHMDQCRGAIPAWIMPIHKVVETVRPGRDAFDVIIVDEASQSGPEALFLLYLGKQLVVVGDDKQISPDTVGLDRSDVDALRDQFLKDIPHSDAIGIEHSFFDQAKIRYRGKIRLKEHFRCMPEIIQFSNNLCYSSDPLIPLRQYGGGRITPVVKTTYVSEGYVDDKSTRPVNIPEAEAILHEISKICHDPAYSGKSIGVISLLNTSGQAKYIDNELRNSDKYISKTEYEDRQIRVGDAYEFQGDERDIIFLSMVSAPVEGGRVYAMTADKDERRFNVAVSRARDQLLLFHSVTLSDLNTKCIRHRLLSYCLNPHVATSAVAGIELTELKRLLRDGYQLQTAPPKPFDSWFEVDVFIRIAERGYRVLPQVESNGFVIDLIVEGIRGRLAVECDGDMWHGPDKYDADMARQRDLERCGMQFWRVRGSAFYYNPDDALEDLWSLLEKMEIFPVLHDKNEKNTNSSALENQLYFGDPSDLLVAEESE